MNQNSNKEKTISTASITSNGMYIVDVIPLSRGFSKETLSYFTAKPVSLGDIALVPVRKKEIPAIVVSIRDAASAKTDVKQSAYGLRKITGIRSPDFFLPAFIAASEKTARYFATGTGAIIEALTPKTVLDAMRSGTLTPPTAAQKIKNEDGRVFEVCAFQAPEKDRFAAYKGIVREEFAKNRSVLFLTPTEGDIAYAVSSIGRGIEEYVHTFYGGLTKQKMLDVWHSAVKETHPVLIIGTGVCLSVPRQDIGTIITENEQSWVYKQERRPFVDIRTFAEYFAEALKGRFIAGGTALRLETLYRRETEDILDFAPPQFRILSPAEQSIVDMRSTHNPLQLTPKTFTLVSDDLKQAIEGVHEQNQNIFLFVSRRGLYPITLCSDCGAVVLCPRCTAPLVLHKETKKSDGATERVFLCHKCGDLNTVKDRCKNCDSWRLAPLGVGSERVEEEVRRLFPSIKKIVRVDKDKTPSRKKAEQEIAEFLNTPGSILIGTELALNILKKKIAVTAALSIDPLFALPSFRMNERAFQILLSLREKANKKFIIQTRIPDTPVFRHVQNGNITDFYTEEKTMRQTLGYPPFTTLIKLTTTGTKQNIDADASFIKKHLRGYEIVIFPAFISKVRDKYIMHAVIKIKRGEWPNEKLRMLLSMLPPSVAIDIDPEHLL